MKTINQKKELEDKIAYLKNKQSAELLDLKNQYQVTIDSLKPVNLIKNSLSDVLTSPGLKGNLISGAISMGTSYLANNVLNENSTNPIKKVLSKIVKFAMKNFIEKKQ